MDDQREKQFEDWGAKQRKKDKVRERTKEWRTTIITELFAMLKARLTRFQWSTEGWPASQGRQRVDILGESKVPRYFVFIEIEADRVGCARNIVKAWMYIEQNTDSGPVLLVSIFSPFFASKNRSGKEEAFFVAAKAQKDTNQKLTYKYIENDEWPVNSAQYATVVSNMVAQIDDFITGYERLLS